MKSTIPNPFPYQGSKRNLLLQIAPFILPCNRLIEPFAGAAAISLYALKSDKANSVWINDINDPLMGIYQEILKNPESLVDKYAEMWNAQSGQEKEFYCKVREEFNITKNPVFLLFLLSRCVKGAVRYNTKGGFSQSPDNRRLGRKPDYMKNEIFKTHEIICNRAVITSYDYREVIERATIDDIVYLDPPYQGVCTGKDNRYYSAVSHTEFVEVLESMSKRGLRYVVSYDGKLGEKLYGESIPSEELGLSHFHVKAGRSSQATLLGRKDVTIESLYVSRNLMDVANLLKNEKEALDSDRDSAKIA